MTETTKTVLTPKDFLYPESLAKLADSPSKLYVCGNPRTLNDSLILITGTRRATPYGISCASLIGKIAAECGLAVVSGAAMGCEASALRAAMQAGGHIVVVAGSGADITYPRSSEDIFKAASTGFGCVVSEQDWGTMPFRQAFVHRRRLMAAISNTVVITEAGNRSGTTAIAEVAAEFGKKVYAFPGSIFSPESRGANSLISDGAIPIIDAEDFRMSLMIDFPSRQHPLNGTRTSLNPHMDQLIRFLTAAPMSLEQIIASLGIEPLKALDELYDYESKGLVVRLPDGRWAPTSKSLLDFSLRQIPPPESQDAER